MFRYSYKNNLLRIRCVAFDRGGSQSIREQLFRVPPVYRDVRPDEEADATLPSLNTRWLCNHFLVHFADGQLAILTRVIYQPQEKRWVRFDDVPGGVAVAVSKEFIEGTGREILRESGIIKT